MKHVLNNSYRRLLFLRRELLAYYHYRFSKTSPEQIRVVLFAQGRTGSTLLENLISATGHFESHGELLNVSKGEVLFPAKFIFGLSKRNNRQNFIFHVKVYQLVRDRRRQVDPSKFLQKLQDAGWKIIYLRRRNKVRHELSNLVAEARSNYFKFDKKKEEFRLDVDLDSFTERVKDRFRFERAEEKILNDLEFIEVVYEDDLENNENHQQTVKRILDYLDLESRRVSTEYKKVNTRPLNDLIANYDEFVKRMKKEGWSKYLD